ncbi:MAG: glycoside hydrolase family 65 protein [Lachnospiraceae bacterium]|nr:glycoside hydrolase family 65 protein [Lachnospiraceae bacterium]
MGMDYSKVSEGIIREDSFEPLKLGKCEAIMSLGNGYIGIRSATEERYLRETRGVFVAGTFNKFDENEVTELPNAADMMAVELTIDGEPFDLTVGSMESYTRELNVKTGELKRSVIWTSPSGKRVSYTSYRVVSLKRLHWIAQRIEVTPLDEDVTIKIRSGINGTMTNTGSQHFSEGDKRFYDKRFIQFVQRTTQSGIDFVNTTSHKLVLGGKTLDLEAQVYIERREIFAGYEAEVKAGELLEIEKYSNVYTTRDFDAPLMMVTDAQEAVTAELQKTGLSACKEMESMGYRKIADESAGQWEKEVWSAAPIHIEDKAAKEGQTSGAAVSKERQDSDAAASKEGQTSGTAANGESGSSGDSSAAVDQAQLDQFALYFAQYHMRVMVPAHDNRMNIGAKGLSGEGYKGHCFWDTEIFLLPYYIFTNPEIARKLEEYRYLSLPGAHAKAAHNGYQGAMFPWESAWLDDGEVTPEYCDVDILTGLPIKVWSGIIEQHITSDVAFGAWQYAVITGDEQFMDDYGYELIMDTACFWASRLEPGEDGFYHINDVVGPDEFREHVNDNAFTNYMARWNMSKAMEYYQILKEEKPELFARLEAKWEKRTADCGSVDGHVADGGSADSGITEGIAADSGASGHALQDAYEKWKDGCEHIFLPVPNDQNVLPQDDRYLSCRDIDLTKYKQQEHIGGIMRDYNLEQINQIQVSKQADVLVLFFLLEDQFSPEVKAATWKYYEQRTIHDSSLSLSTHAVLACDMGEKKMAYDLFRQASMIDLGPFMGSSNMGIHAASFGGVWQCVVYGFGGVRMLGGKLRINPLLPDAWEKLSYTIIWKGQKLAVEVTKDEIVIENLTGNAPVELEVAGQPCVLKGKLAASL